MKNKLFVKLSILFYMVCMLLISACGKTENISLHFMVDGEIYKTVTTAGNETIELPEDPSKDGYVFEGWYWDDGTWQRPFTVESLLNEALTEDMTVYAKWEAIEYIATFKNGDDVVGTVKFTVETDALTEPDVPDRPGYTGAWEAYTPGAEDITINAVYTPITYTIVYENTKGAASSNATEYTVESDTIQLSGIELDGYIFVGWYNGETKVTEIPAGSMGNITLTANWLSADDFVMVELGDDVTLVEYKGAATHVVLPDGITVIAATAFRNNTGILSLSVPDSVKSIEFGAISGCNSLESITLPFVGGSSDGTGNTHFGYIFGASGYSEHGSRVPSSLKTVVITGGTGIASDAFRDCGSLESITIPADVTSIGNSAFQGCGSLQSLAIPAGVTSIGSYAFRECSSLESITIPEGVTSIGSYAFYNCVSLTGITIPASVTSVNERAFYCCNSLTAITVDENNPKYHSAGNCLIETESKTLLIGCSASVIPDDGSVTSIGNYAFRSCTGLTGITIPASVTSIAEASFRGCNGLTSITADENNPKYHSAGNCLIETESKTLIVGCNTSIIPDDGSVTSIGAYAFYDCDRLTSITIPASVTFIGQSAFNICNDLTSVTVLGSTDISDSAFQSCTKLESVSIPNATVIGDSAFRFCSSLTGITIPASVTYIGETAFFSCESLNSITVDENNPKYHSAGNCLIETESKRLIAGCNASVIPDDGSVTSIADFTFHECDDLTSVTIPDSVTSIGRSAFNRCENLKSVVIGNNVTKITEGAFSNCKNLESVIIGNSVESTEQHAFGTCTSLTNVTIPASMKHLKSLTFYNCSSLTSIIFQGTKSQWDAIIKDYNWDGNTGNYTIHCTDGSFAK